MSEKEENNAVFYDYDSSKIPKINNRKLLSFLGKNGFTVMNIGGSSKLVRIVDNVIEDTNEESMSRFIGSYLESNGKIDVLECFIKGASSYLNKSKQAFLPKINWISDKDTEYSAHFYFKNTAVKVTKLKLEFIPYSKLNHPIWKNRIIDRDFNPTRQKDGQFEDFCSKLSKDDLDRLKALKTAIGYLLHRHNNPSLVKAILLIDENATKGGETNGGTGKSLIFKALSKCSETVLIDGKNMKTDSRFNNQRLKHTSDIINYDDINNKFSLEQIYSMTTSGIIIEQKGKDECILSSEDAPKIMITSNQHVHGPGGSSDRRRRYEFEVSNYFSDTWSPKDEYGNLFFDEWDENEWIKFDYFMIECVQLFLTEGLIEAKSLRKRINKLIELTSPEFHDFITKGFLETGKWIDKKHFLKFFKEKKPHLEDITSHILSKWVKLFAIENDLEYKSKKTGNKYEFKLKARNELNNKNGDENENNI